MRDEVVFFLNGEERRVKAPSPERTLLEWLREDARCAGTKEGCAEGDCGACTVLIARAGPDGATLRPINSCIFYLPMADGLDLISVEGLSALQSEPNGLHPAQTAMVAEHASQCGFCTPGFVMALAAWQASAKEEGEEALRDALAGNLCRCTGYGPILNAGRRLKTAPVVAKPRPDLPCGDTALGFELPGGQGFFAPQSLDILLTLYDRHPGATLVAGATDVGLWTTKLGKPITTLISLRQVEELALMVEDAAGLTLGAAVTYADAEDALSRLHPAFARYVSRIGGPQVRESGTIGGNIANGSPIGDMPPALIALGAEIELASSGGARRIALEDFFIAYGKQDRAPGEVLTRIFIPKPEAGALFAAEKLSKRPDQDISAISAGFYLRMHETEVAEARIAFGGMAGTPMRAKAAEAALTGRTFDDAAIAGAMAALANDFTPLSDHRASAAYRLLGAQGLLQRFYLRVSGGAKAPALERL